MSERRLDPSGDPGHHSVPGSPWQPPEMPDELTFDWSTGEYGADRRVGTYSLVDVRAQYAGFRNARIAVGAVYRIVAR